MRSGELVATDESAMITKPFPDAIVMEDSQGDGCFPDSTCTNESDRCTVFSESNDPLDQLVASKTGLRWWGRGFPRYAGFKCKTLGPLVVYITDLIWVWATVSYHSAMDRARVSLTGRR